MEVNRIYVIGEKPKNIDISGKIVMNSCETISEDIIGERWIDKKEIRQFYIAIDMNKQGSYQAIKNAIQKHRCWIVKFATEKVMLAKAKSLLRLSAEHINVDKVSKKFLIETFWKYIGIVKIKI